MKRLQRLDILNEPDEIFEEIKLFKNEIEDVVERFVAKVFNEGL